MEGLLNEIENVIDSYLDKSTVSESLDVKNELDAEEIRDKELDSNDSTGTLTENELDADDIKDKELDSKDPTATLTENELDAEHIQNKLFSNNFSHLRHFSIFVFNYTFNTHSKLVSF